LNLPAPVKAPRRPEGASIPLNVNCSSVFNLRCGREMTLVVDNSPAAAGGFRSSYRKRPYRRKAKRKPRKKARRKTRKKATIADLHRLPKFSKAQIDPFDPSCDGVKIPDSNTYPSTSLRVEDQFLAQTTDANGLKASFFMPFLENTKVNHTASTASAWTWSAAFGGGEDSTRQSAIASNYTLCRPVAHGLKISCSAAPTSITGNLHVAIVAATNFGKTTWNMPVNITELSNGMFYKKYPLAMFTQQTLTVVNKFIDVTASRYVDPGSDGVANAIDSEFQTNGWAAIVVAIEGAPANTSVLAIEQVVHYEAIPKVEAVDSASPAAAYNVNTLQQSSRLAGQVPAAFTEQERQSYLHDVIGAIGQGVYGAYGNVFLPGVRSASYAAASAALSYAARRSYGIPGITQFRNPSAFQSLM